MKHWVWIALAGLGLMGAPAFAADYPTNSGPAEPPRPGTLNYIQGLANLDGRALNNNSVGNAAMNAGDLLTTGSGKAEILLTPGIFLRIDSNSAVKMISPDIEATRIEVEHGRASVEIDQILPQNMVQIVVNGETAQLMKKGYYEFGAAPPEIMVFKGEARVQSGVGRHVGEGKWAKVKGAHELALVPGIREKSEGFDTQPTDDGLYTWSSLRSQYLAQANEQIADQYSGPGFNPGWYWNPYMFDYTYLGWDPFFSPFGWGFSPWGGFYGGGFYGGGFYGRPWYGGGGGWYGGRGWNGGGRGWNGRPMPGGGAHGFRGGGGFHGGGFGGGGRR